MKLRAVTVMAVAAAVAFAFATPAQRTGKRGTAKGSAEAERHVLTKDELKSRLADFKQDILEEMFSKKMVKEPLLARKWLAKFQVIQSDHYLLFTDGPRHTCKKFAVSLEKLYEFVRSEFPFDDIDAKLECLIFKTKEEYVTFCVRLVGWEKGKAEMTAGHATSKYYATYYQSPTADTVMHEATHQIVGACLGIVGVGSWFQEGMAVYIERKIGNTKPSSGMKSDLRSGNYVPLSVFCGLKSVLFSSKPSQARRGYRHAGALIDFLANTRLEPVAGRFDQFLAGAKVIGRSLAASEALVREVYGLSLDELEGLWKKHLKVR